MEYILTLVAIILLISLPIIVVIQEIRSDKEFKKALEQLAYEDALNDISNLIKSKFAESTKIKKIKEVLNKLKKNGCKK